MYIKQTLSNGDIITINEIKGIDYFNAAKLADGNTGVLPLYLLIECSLVNGKQMDMEYFKQMDISDINPLMDALASQLQKL